VLPAKTILDAFHFDHTPLIGHLVSPQKNNGGMGAAQLPLNAPVWIRQRSAGG
jgi:hypothetical protein